jgi:hypothetical protein
MGRDSIQIPTQKKSEPKGKKKGMEEDVQEDEGKVDGRKPLPSRRVSKFPIRVSKRRKVK